MPDTSKTFPFVQEHAGAVADAGRLDLGFRQSPIAVNAKRLATAVFDDWQQEGARMAGR
jgi:hypothetical protein